MNTQQDIGLIQKLWRAYAPYWHVCSAVLLVIIYLCTFIGLPDRVGALEAKAARFELVGQRVEDIADFMGVPKRYITESPGP